MIHIPKSLNLTTINHIKNQMQHSDYETAYADFQQTYPAYHKTLKLNELRTTEYQRLDTLKQVYLDYTGGGLYSVSQLNQHMHILKTGVYGNPHSANPTSLAMTELDEHARQYVLEFFNANSDEYTVIFTQNASGALRLVGEAYPFEKNGQYLLTFDNHNSVNGIREFARHNNAPVTYLPVLPPDLRVNTETLMQHLDAAHPNGNNLFAYPAQSNFSGVQHPLEWIEIAHEKGWDVLLDSAAFAPTNCLDLNKWKPDFVPLSFYKIFGYPTGIGALIARTEKLKKLRRPWFAGGTITVASVQGDAHWLEDGFAAFEDGTIDYLNLPAIEIGLKHIRNIGIETIHERVMVMTQYLLDELTQLYHDNNKPLVTFYGPLTTEARGGTISMNLYDVDGHAFDYQVVEALANHVNISLRTGCFCNPGAGELALNIKGQDIINCFEDNERMSFEQFVTAMTSNSDYEAVGAIRVSVGIATNFRDVFHFVQFAKSFLNMSATNMSFAD